MEYVPIQKEKAPYRFQVALPYKLYDLTVRYNETHDFFTLDVWQDEEVLVEGEKMVFGVPLFIDSYALNFPPLLMVPRNRSGTVERAGYDNFGETVFLVVES